jgi:hypothetical protein
MNCYGCVTPCCDSFDNYGCESKVLKAQNEETLDRDKSEELWNEIKYIEYLISKLGGCVQNPDFVDKSNVRDNYEIFINSYTKIIDRLEKLKENIFEIHDNLVNS